jgi:hypothetical protein
LNIVNLPTDDSSKGSEEENIKGQVCTYQPDKPIVQGDAGGESLSSEVIEFLFLPTNLKSLEKSPLWITPPHQLTRLA